MVKVVPLRFQQCLVPLSMLLVEGPLKLDFLDIYLTTLLGVRNFGNTSAVRIIFFFENIQNLIYISKMQEEIEKMFFVSGIIGSGLAL